MTLTENVADHFESVLVRLPASPRYLRVARVVAGALADELGADIDALDDVRLAVSEVCNLAVLAGAQTIDLHFEITGNMLTVSGEASPTTADFASQLGFAEQILEVTAAEYELKSHPGAVSFRLRFRGTE